MGGGRVCKNMFLLNYTFLPKKELGLSTREYNYKYFNLSPLEFHHRFCFRRCFSIPSELLFYSQSCMRPCTCGLHNNNKY